jgi:hypothetical protein
MSRVSQWEAYTNCSLGESGSRIGIKGENREETKRKIEDKGYGL